MKGAERAFVIWALSYLAVYVVIAVSVACAVHPDSSSIRYLIPFHLLGFAQNVAALILTIKDLFQREFPNPNVMRCEDTVNQLPLPAGLTRLIAAGVWPSATGPSMNEQQLHPTIPADRVQRFAAEETLICLQPPPFPTIAGLRAAGGAGDFWERFGALEQIDPERALVIGDFGLGSDSPVILDFAQDAINPPVLRLRWRERGQGNEWVQGARDIDELAEMLGLAEGIA